MYAIYANKPHKRATIHLRSCSEYTNRLYDETENGIWLIGEDLDTLLKKLPRRKKIGRIPIYDPFKKEILSWVKSVRWCSKCRKDREKLARARFKTD